MKQLRLLGKASDERVKNVSAYGANQGQSHEASPHGLLMTAIANWRRAGLFCSVPFGRDGFWPELCPNMEADALT